MQSIDTTSEGIYVSPEEDDEEVKTETTTTEPTTTDTPTFQKFSGEKIFNNKQEQKQEHQQQEENMNQTSYEPMIDESRNIPGAQPTLSIYDEALNQFQKLFHLFGPGAIGLMTGQPALANAFMKFTEDSKNMIDNTDVARSFIDTMGPSLLKTMQKKKLTNSSQHINHFRSQNIEQNVNPVVSDVFFEWISRRGPISTNTT